MAPPSPASPSQSADGTRPRSRRGSPARVFMSRSGCWPVAIAVARSRCYGDNVDRAARLRRLLVILSMATAQPGGRAQDLAEGLGVSTRTLLRDLAPLHRLGVRVAFGD